MKTCGNNILIINILMHMLILFTILNIFFNKFVKQLTTYAINNELINGINDAFSKNQANFEKNKNVILLNDNYYNYYNNLFLKENIERVYINNNVLQNINTFNITLGIVFILFLVFSFYYHLIDQDEFSKLIVENILTFICVGVIEYLFFTQIAIKYIPVEPSYISNSFITNLKQKFI